MSKQKLSQKFKNWADSRSQNQKLLTKQLVQKLSDINKQRVQQHKYDFKQLFYEGKHTKQETLFLLFSGVPPHPKQYAAYNFPGKVVNFIAPGYQPNFQQIYDTQQKRKQYLLATSMQQTIQKIDSIVDEHTKNSIRHKVFIVCHSFGSFIASAYCVKNPTKVVGFISIGGPALHFYSVFKDYVKALFSIPGMTRQILVQSYQMIYSLYDQQMQKHPTMQRFHTPYQHISFIMHNLQQDIDLNFNRIRQLLPNKIKCFIYGSKDSVIAPSLLQQYASFITYLMKKNSDHQYLQTFKKNFYKLKGNEKCIPQIKKINLQQNFIFCLQKAPHGVHYSPGFTQFIQKIMNEYIYIVLETERALSFPKL